MNEVESRQLSKPIAMALTEHYYTKFEEGSFYHVYNRVVDRKPLFTEKRNYFFFLSRMVKYIIPYLDVYAFCLLDNHFHLLVKIKKIHQDLTTLKELSNLGDDLENNPVIIPEVNPIDNPNIIHEDNPENEQQNKCHYIISAAFKKMFQSYAMAFNKQEDRIGTLFQTPFKRSEIDSEEYLLQLIYYIHSNPQKHGLVNDFRSYPYSSFHFYANRTPGYWMHDELLDLFGGYEGFMEFHNSNHDDHDKRHVIENE